MAVEVRGCPNVDWGCATALSQQPGKEMYSHPHFTAGETRGRERFRDSLTDIALRTGADVEGRQSGSLTQRHSEAGLQGHPSRGQLSLLLPHPHRVLPGSLPLGFRQLLLTTVGIMSQRVLPHKGMWKTGFVERFPDQ